MGDSVRAWHPGVPYVREVLHATFERHSYPSHTHADWTVLLIDQGAVTYDLDHTEHQAVPASITLLPPHVPHDGRSAVGGEAFRKRVLYLSEDWLPAEAADMAASRPRLLDPAMVTAVKGIHAALSSPADAMAAECGVLSLQSSVQSHLRPGFTHTHDAPLARRLRELLDDRLLDSFTIAEAANILGAHPGHLVRAFSKAYGIAPYRYVTGRRVDRARRLLLDGVPASEAAVESGFHDQSHLTRHFRRVLGTTPGTFAP
ncbi:AraC family transcriptional regulator [Paenarthrobacter nitroguajacolicus]|uniref:AraC family transcriptional regulator n=1 Tax=Paenarthrobacter nitroguajacolicus TaxID=211146 RepID=UPI00248B7EC9|nr:AraC family transcriptional regulator [Paenarthrobacter nitroguajacolicus]